MNNDFYERFKTYSRQQIFDMLKKKEDYQPEAVSAAELILRENEWESELAVIIDKENQFYQDEITEKAEYYKKAVEFQKDKNSFNIRICDVPKFESSLIKHDIDFFREDKNVGVQLDSYPTETYYFKEKDVVEVDKICIDLKLITQPYADVKPFFKFELKVLLIIIIAVVIIVLVYLNS